MYLVCFTVLLAPGVVEDKLQPSNLQYPAWIMYSDGRRTRVRMVLDSVSDVAQFFRDVADQTVVDTAHFGFYTNEEFPLPDWFDTTGYVRFENQGDVWYNKPFLSHGAPVYDSVKGGKIKATITMAKPESKIYQKPQVIEEITGDDATRMGLHIEDFLYWLQNYDAYYSCKGWTYEVKWKGLPTPA